jgi:hypothetical protein
MSSIRPHGGTKTAELTTVPNGVGVPAGPGPDLAAGPLKVRGPSWMKLSGGMVIGALIEARLFGKRLLTLEADVTVLPAESAAGPGTVRSPGKRLAAYPGAHGLRAGGLAGPGGGDGSRGGAHEDRLTRAADSLKQAAEDLARARSAMP